MASAVFIAVWDDVKYRARLVRPAQQANPSSFTAGHFPLARQKRNADVTPLNVVRPLPTGFPPGPVGGLPY